MSTTYTFACTQGFATNSVNLGMIGTTIDAQISGRTAITNQGDLAVITFSSALSSANIALLTNIIKSYDTYTGIGSLINFQGSSTANGVNLSSLIINVPSNTLRDMFMLCHITLHGTTNYLTYTTPSGWKLIRTTQNTDSSTYWRTMLIFVKNASSNEPASYTWSSLSPTTNYIVGGMTVYSGVAAFNFINAESGQSTANSLSHDVPSITTTIANTMLVTYYSYASCATSWTLNGGLMQAYSVNSGTAPSATGEGNVCGYKFQSAIGTTGGVGAFTAIASNNADVGLTDILALTPMVTSMIQSTVSSLDIGVQNATIINLGNQNVPTNMYNGTTYAGYPTTVGLTVIAAASQSSNMMELHDVNNNILAGFDSGCRLFLYETETAPAAPSSGVKMFAKIRAGRRMGAQIGVNGNEYQYQPGLFIHDYMYWNAQGGSTTVSTIGFNNTASGTITTRNVSSTTLLTSTRRCGFVSTAATGSSAGTRHGIQQFWLGNSPGLGGFFYVAKFGLSSAANIPTQRSFVGLVASTSALGNADASTNTNILGFGVDQSDQSWSFMHNAASTTTKDALTGTFPPRDLSVSCFEARIYSPSNSGTVYYSLEVLNGGSIYEGSTSTNIPALTTFLSPQLWTNNGTSALACGIDVISQYMETDF